MTRVPSKASLQSLLQQQDQSCSRILHWRYSSAEAKTCAHCNPNEEHESPQLPSVMKHRGNSAEIVEQHMQCLGRKSLIDIMI